jgi:pyruvate/2-oxoglutarate dehydrogenase complex dihydrolipoamide dehydrogenase (E3) component
MPLNREGARRVICRNCSTIEDLLHENAGVAYGKAGIIVNDELKTTTDSIYACGDVIGKYLFTQAASFYAGIAVNNIVNSEKPFF